MRCRLKMALLKLWREGRAKSGRRDSLRVIDYDYLESQWLGFDFGAEEETPAGKGLAVRVHSLGDSTGAELLICADGAGCPLRMLDPETGAEQLQVDEATARARRQDKSCVGQSIRCRGVARRTARFIG